MNKIALHDNKEFNLTMRI